MALFTRNLMALDAFIEKLQSLFINVKAAIFGGSRFTLNNLSQLVDNGSHLQGFCLNSNGILKASGAEISGTLQANFIELTGNVTAGTNFVLRRNNTITSVSFAHSNLSIKELSTPARGSVTVRVSFLNGDISGIITCVIRLNGNNVVTFPLTALNYNYDNNIILSNSINLIELVFLFPSSYLGGLNTNIFELRCNDDPKFLRVLG